MSDKLELILKVHGELSRIVRPATAESIRSSLIRNNTTLLIVIFGGVFSFLFFLLPVWFDSISKSFQIIGAAGLGITFHTLYTANKYLKNNTYKKSYDQGYLINYALGIFAGSILGLFGQELFPAAPDTINYQPNVLALIGGYSAEAVAQILQRVSETLVTVVRGNQSDKSQAEASKKISQNSSEVAARLSKLKNAKPEEVKNGIENIVQELLDKS